MTEFRTHHFTYLRASRDHLSETIIFLRSALEVMTGDDWIDAKALLDELVEDIAPRLSRLRTDSSDRFDEWSRHPDFDAMRYGKMPYPDERPREVEEPPAPSVTVSCDELLVIDGEPWLCKLPEGHDGDCSPHRAPPLNAPNAKRGAELVAQHGGVDEAMMAYQPDSAEFDHIQAYRYVSTGQRPKGWIPAIVPAPGEENA